jgi:hypothetical protein
MGGEPEHVESTAAQQAAFSFVAARSFEDARPLKMARSLKMARPFAMAARSKVARSFRGAVALMRPVVQGLA